MKQSKLFPRVFDIANVEIKLKQIIKPIYVYPIVTEMATNNRVRWTVS